MIDVSTLAGFASTVTVRGYSINNSGAMVGFADGPPNRNGFVYNGGPTGGSGAAQVEFRIGSYPVLQAMLANTDLTFGGTAVSFNIGNSGNNNTVLQVNSLAGGSSTTFSSRA